MNFDLCWSAFCFFNIGPTGVNNISIASYHKKYFVKALKFLFSLINISPSNCRLWIITSCVFISISLLLSYNFLISQIARCYFYRLATTNSMPAKFIATRIFLHNNIATFLSVFAIMFYNNFFFVFRKVYTIEPSFFKSTYGMNRRPFEGRHLVSLDFHWSFSDKCSSTDWPQHKYVYSVFKI